MSDEPPRRPILKLKNAPPPKPAPEPEPAPRLGSPRFAKPMRPRAPPPPPPPVHTWKCRPCGTGFTPSPDLPDEESVRCPACNARLGLAADFRSDPPNIEKLRARAAKR
jgi:hypothetical protein